MGVLVRIVTWHTQMVLMLEVFVIVDAYTCFFSKHVLIGLSQVTAKSTFIILIGNFNLEIVKVLASIDGEIRLILLESNGIAH